MIPNVDLIVLSRQDGPLHPEVELGIRTQRGVKIVVHRVFGPPAPHDRCRRETIARARNKGKLRGEARWVMFVDDDVALHPRCVRVLVDELRRRPAFGALAADYLGQHREGQISDHVSMGATLFRREALDAIRFTWSRDKCECSCCCDDLRRMLWGIDYCQAARARHLGKQQASAPVTSRPMDSTAKGYVLAAFNRRHRRNFEQRFLRSLRASGNGESVIALAMGMYPSEQRQLRRLPNVKCLFRPDNGQFVGRQRMRAFPEVLRSLPRDVAVAYWDAGDVIFQGRLTPLWQIALAHPDKVLAVREPASHPENPTVAGWSRGIANRAARRRAQRLLYSNPFLNAGFMAGTAGSLLKYFSTVAGWYRSPKLAGTSNPGDQMALNLFCHSNPDKWHEVAEGWNYCLARRDLRTVYRDRDGRYVDVRNVPIYAVHGNAHTLGLVRSRHERLRRALL